MTDGWIFFDKPEVSSTVTSSIHRRERAAISKYMWQKGSEKMKKHGKKVVPFPSSL